MNKQNKVRVDIFGGLFYASPMYCENNECDDFGYLKMAGIKKEKEITLE